jgi:phage tail tape-measure protein
MKLQHTRDRKQIADAGKSEVANTRKELDELHSEIKEVQGWLQEELQAEKDLRELEKKRNDALEEVKETQAKIIKDLDEQVGSKLLNLFFVRFSLFLCRLTFIPE